MDLEDAFRSRSSSAEDEARARGMAAAVLRRLERRRKRARLGGTFLVLALLAAVGVAGAFVFKVERPAPPRVARTTHSPGPAATTTTATTTTAATERLQFLRRVTPRLPERTRPADSARELWSGCRSSKDLALYLAEALPNLEPALLAQIRLDVREARNYPPGTSQSAWWDSFALALGRSRAREAWPILEALLDARGASLAAIEAAGELGDGRAVPRLKRWLCLADARSEAAARALGEIPGRDSLLALLAALDSTRGVGALVPALRREIEAALRGREAELPRAVEAAPQERARVFRALCELRTRSAAEVLVRALGDPALHDYARQSLLRIAKKDFGHGTEAWRQWLEEVAGEWNA